MAKLHTAIVTLAMLVMCWCRGGECRAHKTRNVHDDAELMPGWLGSDYKPPVPIPIDGKDRYMEVLNADARIFLWHKFLSAEEADHVRMLGEKGLTRSGVVNTDGSSSISEVRTSYGTFLKRAEDEVIRRIEDRIARWTLMPAGNGEGLQILRYRNGQKYDAHWDYFFDKADTSNGGNRYSTVLMYLEDTEEGGETVFPNIPVPGGNPGFSSCAAKSLAAQPRKGDAILFHSMKPDGSLEKLSLHTACPVLKGTKWSAAKWIHERPYQMNDEYDKDIAAPVPTKCSDQEALCNVWAQQGECTRNPRFMIGTRAAPGRCVLSCQQCHLVEAGAPEDSL